MENAMVQTQAQAERVVLEHLHRQREDITMVVVRVEERSYGWIVYCASEAYLRTKRFKDIVLGLGPVIITRDGHIHSCGTANPAKDITSFEDRLATR
jgi:hypothetical protein